MTTLTRGALHGIQAFSHSSETKIRNACMPGVVYKYVYLVVREYSGGAILKATTYPLEVPMDDIAGAEVEEAPGDVEKLVRE